MGECNRRRSCGTDLAKWAYNYWDSWNPEYCYLWMKAPRCSSASRSFVQKDDHDLTTDVLQLSSRAEGRGR